MQVDPAKLHDFAARYTAAWCSQGPTSVAAFYSVEGSLTVNGGAPAVARDAIMEVARSFMTAYPDMRVVMGNLIMKNDRTEYHWTLIGTNTGPVSRVNSNSILCKPRQSDGGGDCSRRT